MFRLLKSSCGKYICLAYDIEKYRSILCIFRENDDTSAMLPIGDTHLYITSDSEIIDNYLLENNYNIDGNCWDFLLRYLPIIKKSERDSLPLWMKESIILKILEK